MYQAVMSSCDSKQWTGKGSLVEAGRRLQADTLELECRFPSSGTRASYSASLILTSHHWKMGVSTVVIVSSLEE